MEETKEEKFRRVAKVMLQDGLSFADACEVCGVNYSTYYSWLRKKAREASDAALKKHFHRCLMCGKKISAKEWYCASCKEKKTRIASACRTDDAWIYGGTGDDDIYSDPS